MSKRARGAPPPPSAQVLARVGHYLRTRIPDALEVEIEDETQLDDSPEAFEL